MFVSNISEEKPKIRESRDDSGNNAEEKTEWQSFAGTCRRVCLGEERDQLLIQGWSESGERVIRE